jgi:hypothetical protein
MDRIRGSHIDWSTGGAGIGFGHYGADDEVLHLPENRQDATVSETWLYMWYVPEAQIGAFAYVWVHPNLDVLTSGLSVYQGRKHHHLEAEIMDFRGYLPAQIVRDGGMGRDIKIPNGLRIEIVDPLERIRITYEDEARGNRVDVTLTAASPPIMRENMRHFDQVLHANGTIVLGGQEHEVDGYAMRDRSWDEPRPEHIYPIPPFTWMTGTFPESKISWHLCAYDDPALSPDWLGKMDNPATIFREGWVYRDGEMLRLRSASQVTARDLDRRAPLSACVRLVDSRNRSYDIVGTVVASTVWSQWPNMRAQIGLARWEMSGAVGWGDIQEFQSGDYVRAMANE